MCTLALTRCALFQHFASLYFLLFKTKANAEACHYVLWLQSNVYWGSTKHITVITFFFNIATYTATIVFFLCASALEKNIFFFDCQSEKQKLALYIRSAVLNLLLFFFLVNIALIYQKIKAKFIQMWLSC